MKKACKVVTTYFGERRARPRNFDETADLFQKMIDKEKITDAGVECDTIIVNHLLKDNNERAARLLDSVNGTQTKNGKIITMTRPHDNGEGSGFKSRDYAFKKYQDNYEYWFFVEDDLNFFEDAYYKRCIEILESKPHVAFVCTLHDAIVGGGGRTGAHCSGSIGCTHVRFLKELVEANGSIPYPNSNNYKDAELLGEVAGTNIFLEMGYSLARVGKRVHDTSLWRPYDFRWDHLEKTALVKRPYNEYHPKKGYIQ